MNVLSKEKQTTIETLLEHDVSQREISRKLGLDRKTVRRYGRLSGLVEPGGISKSPTPATGATEGENENPPSRPPGKVNIPKHARSACEDHHEWIVRQVELGRNAMAIYQQLVEQHGFAHRYNSVKRYVRGLKRREPERYDRLEYGPGEEAQVDYGQGAWVEQDGKKRRPRLFVMTLKYSRRSFRKVVWRSSQETWARLHEEAFRYFGGCVQYVVLDNLKEGVVKPDIYEPTLNPVYTAMLEHYGVVADPARVGDPNRKGTVENAIQHTQATALKGRTFTSLEEQNEWLRHWEENWAARRVLGRTKRQVEEMYQAEKPFLKPLPAGPFRYFREETRRVDDAGLVQVAGSFYAALPAAVGSQVTVRIYDEEVAIIDPQRQETLRRHGKSGRPGAVVMAEGDRVFNPSRQTAWLLAKAGRIGPDTRRLCERWFAEEGRAGQRRMYGLLNLARRHAAADIEAVAGQALRENLTSYHVLARLVAARTAAQAPPAAAGGPGPGKPAESAHGAFWARHAGGDAVTAPADEVPPDFWRSVSWAAVLQAFDLAADDRRSSRPGELWAKSPFTGEATASLHLDDTRKVFKDFSSGLGGGVMLFCQTLRRRQGHVETPRQTLQWMVAAGLVATAGPAAPPALAAPAVRPAGPRENPPAPVDLRPYLRWDHPALVARGLSMATCHYLGCGFLPLRTKGRPNSPLNGRLVFPVRSLHEGPDGPRPVVVSHAGRALDPADEAAHGKYWCYPFHKGLELYNQDNLLFDPQARLQLRQHGLLLVEGFGDVAALVEAGCRNVAALMGVELTTRQAERLAWLQARLGFPQVRLFLDRDRAGRAGARRAAATLRQAGFVVTLFDWDRWVDWPPRPPGPLPPALQDPGDLSPLQLRWLRQQQLI